MKKFLKIIFISFAIVIAFNFKNSKVDALYYDKSYYDAISFIYSYEAPNTYDYNCLGWATGSMTWEWPSQWGEGTSVQIISLYLNTKNYSLSSAKPNFGFTKLLAYGPSSNKITHFAKVASGKVTAKWGALERFSHSTTFSPYYENSNYGLLRANYVK